MYSMLSSHVILLLNLKASSLIPIFLGGKLGHREVTNSQITQLASGGAGIEAGILPLWGLISLATLLCPLAMKCMMFEHFDVSILTQLCHTDMLTPRQYFEQAV